LTKIRLTMKKHLTIKQNAQIKAHKRAKRFHQGENHWHVNKRSNIIVCKICETKIPIWKNPKYCPICLEGKKLR